VAFSHEGMRNNLLLLGIRVSDTGIGIDNEKLPYIFERFRQAEDSVTRHYGGTGLGLSIVKDLVDLQQGSIRAESVPGKGTSFILVIPYHLPDEGTVVTELTAVTDENLPGLHKIRLLVAEDNAINQQLLKHLLTGWQLDFDMAGNGREAIELLHSNHYDLILMDIQMPEMDGYTATEEIRYNLYIDTPIIAMTAHAMAGEREKCLSLGMNDYISKPIDEDVLYKLIARFAGAGNMADKNAGTNTQGKMGDNNGGSNKHLPAFQYIDLQYMKEIGGGDIEYERSITEQFIEIIPQDLHTMEQAFLNKDFTLLAQLAHNMKTSVSVMGLTASLNPLLDALEYNKGDETVLQDNLQAVKSICIPALLEAKSFYNSLT
jgi:CheY-like chemotaxis protein